MRLRPDNIPDELKALPQWVLHKEKIPYDPKTGRKAKAGKPETWASYEDAQRAYEAGGYSGLGFELNNNGLIGVDIDHCIEAGKLKPEAQAIVDRLGSYTEISPSGTGLHIFVLGDIPEAGRKNPQKGIEFYKASRYLTVTGDLFGDKKPIADRRSEVSELYEELFDNTQEEDDLSDLVLIERAKQAENGKTFTKLYAGEWQGDYKSQSEADLAFCNLLAFWTEKDKERMDRIFRASGLMREKWDRDDYADKTMLRAIRDCQQALGEQHKPVELKKREDYKPYQVVDLLKKTLPPLKWIVHDLIPEGVTLIAAPPKSGKSWWALDLCLSVARGEPFLGRPTTKSGVLYLALEDSERRVQIRANKLLQLNPDTPDGFMCVHKIEPIGDGFEERFTEYVKSCDNLGLVIIDTLEKVRGAGDTKNLYKQDYKDAGLIKDLADKYKIAIVVIHHTKKGQDDSDPFARISGSFGLMGAVDSAMVIDKPKRNDTRAQLIVTGRDVDRQELVMEFDQAKSKWIYLDDAYIETQREQDYKKDPIVITIKDLCAFGAWRGSASDLQAEIEKRTKAKFDLTTLGKSIVRLASPLLEFDEITYTCSKSAGKTIHKFEPNYCI